MITGNEPIQSTPAHKKYNGFGETWVDGSDGLTIRQHFAAMAMQGILANRELQLAIYKDCKIDGTTHLNALAYHAVKEADALIAELNKENNG